MKVKENLDEFARSIKKSIKTILLDIAVGIVSLVYIFYQMLTLEPTKLNPLVLLAQAVIGIIAGVLVKMALGENGFTKGYKSDRWLLALRSYSNKADVALPYINHADEFYEKQRKEKTERNRRTRLASARLKYETFFDENGNYINHEIWNVKKYNKAKEKGLEIPTDIIVLDRKQKKILNKAVAIKIYIRNMFSEYDNVNKSDEEAELTDAKVKGRNLRKNALSATAIAMVGVYFIPTMHWNAGNFIWALLQVSLWIILGIIQLYDNYYFITETKTGYLKLKEIDLSKFIIEYGENGKATIENIIKEKNELNVPKETIIELTEQELKDKGLYRN